MMMVPRKHLILLAAAVLSVLAIFNHPAFAQEQEVYSPDLLAMQGRWVRSDAPYVIELKQDTTKKLQASYFNRRYIHVEKTETARQNGQQFVMIRLKDTNYDGSVYLLGYDRTSDALQGVYIHGASGQRFSVTFSRKKKGA